MVIFRFRFPWRFSNCIVLAYIRDLYLTVYSSRVSIKKEQVKRTN
jgi:hypothetical protein